MNNTPSKILIIEDEPLVLKCLNNFLLALFEVYAAANGQEGWSLITSELPDLVILDLILPKMHGFEVLERAKSHPFTREIPIVILSSLEEEHHVKKGLKLGATDYLIKPEINFETIYHTIQKILKI